MNPLIVRLLASVFLFAPVSSYAGLRAYYSFDSDYSDGSGNGNDLTAANGSPAITTTDTEVAFGGGALNLAGGAHLALSTALNFGASDAWSVSFWARRRDTASTASGMVIGDLTNGGFIWNTANTNQVDGIRFRPSSVSTGGGNNDYATGTDTDYHHWVVVADGAGNITVYQDNASTGTGLKGTVTATPNTVFNITNIGNAYGGTSLAFDGQLDEIYIYDEAIDAAKVNDLYQGGSDAINPTLFSITDDRAGGPVEPDSVVTYTVTFSENMDNATVSAEDFENAGGAGCTIASVSETSAGVFSVPVTPTTSGTLRLQIKQDAVLSDPSGNSLDTGSAIPDDTIITVEADTTVPMLSASDIKEDQSGGPVVVATTVTYTLTFSEDLDESSVDANDFANAGTATVTIGSVSEIAPGVIAVEMTPTSTGTLQFEVISGASILDMGGNALDTSAAIVAETEILVEEGFNPYGVKELKVVFVAGQSNADGRASPSGLPTSPVNLQLPQEDVDFFYRVENNTHPLTTLQPGRSETGGFGPAVTCGRYLADELADGQISRVAVIKYANGGTNLHTQWTGGGNGTTSADGGEYVRFQSTVTAGLAALSTAYPNASIELVGMVWMQGESDAGSTTNAGNYEANLTNFIADVRATYGDDLPFAICRLSDEQTSINTDNHATIRAAQTAVAGAHPLNALVNTDGFGMKGDNLHFDAIGQQQMGNAAAFELLDFQPFLSPPGLVAQVGGAIQIDLEDVFAGYQYVLEANPTLEPGNWSVLETITASGNSVSFSYIPAEGETSQFFRFKRSQP